MTTDRYKAPLTKHQLVAITALKRSLDAGDTVYDLGDFLTFYDDVRSSFIMAMRASSFSNATIESIVSVVDDYIGNTYE